MDYYNELTDTYNKIIKKGISFPVEDFLSVKLVHDYRMYFKPDTVKTLVLAESHVYTTMSDRNIHHNLSNLLYGYPNGFVRFVYCLAYGHNEVLSASIKNNSGTPQFWKLFNNLSGGKFKVTNVPKKEKLLEKVKLLNTMKAEGIWLADASIIALYKDKIKPDGNDYKQILKISFDNFIVPLIVSENPTKIIVVGKSVYDNLFQISGNIFNKKNIEWIHQPNAIFKDPSKRKTISII